MADYIDRKELLKAMQKKHHNLLRNHGVWSEYAYGFDSAMAMVSCQPTADVVEVRHGEWVYYDCVATYDGAKSGFACSVCSGFVDDNIFDMDEFNKDFCGACGAKMDGKGEGE